MTSRETTAIRALSYESKAYDEGWSDRAYRLLYGAIGWPWLLYSLWGGSKTSKRRLLSRLILPDDALPNLGSWKADTSFLNRIVDTIEAQRPRTVVELGAGASTLVCARALQMNGGGTLHSFDQHAQFVSATNQWLDDFGVHAHIQHAPLRARIGDWPGAWYELPDVPHSIDLLIIDGPPWAVHPFVRGAAESLFDRLSPGGVILLDDAARPGERIVARRWTARWPDITFKRLPGGSKGTLEGRKMQSGKVLTFPERTGQKSSSGGRRAAAALALLASGWAAHDMVEDMSRPAHAASFVDEANASYSTSLVREAMRSQVETPFLDRSEIARSLGIALPGIPAGWRVADVQVFPSDGGNSVALALQTDQLETVVLYARRAETPAEAAPLTESRENRNLAYWETGPFAYALTGEVETSRILLLASTMASIQASGANTEAT